MGPTALATGLPTATSWYLNPYFMATFGAIAALGLVVFAIAYFVFVKLKVGQATPAVVDSCATCGMTGEMITRLIPCKEHSGLTSDIKSILAWIKSHEEDHRRLAKRIDDLSDRGGR